MTPIQNILSEYLREYTDDVKYRHFAAGQIATGKTRDKIHFETEATADGAHGTVYGPAHTGTLETGRKAGRVPKGFYYIIMRWAQTKGIGLQGADLQRFSYFVAKRIREQGTRLYRAGGRTDIYTEPAELFAARLAKELAGTYTEEIKSDLIGVFK